MRKIKIVFLDGMEVEVEMGKNTFSRVCVLAAYQRLQAGAATYKELTVDEKKCSVVIPAKAGIQEG